MVGVLKILIYLCAGEVIVAFTKFPIPGPIIGLAFMLVDFATNQKVDSDVAGIFDRVSQHLAVLFVPAGAGVIAHSEMLAAGLIAIAMAIVIGTLLTMLVTAFCFCLLLGGKDVRSNDCVKSSDRLREMKS